MVEPMFDSIPDEQLINELIRRGYVVVPRDRVRVVQTQTVLNDTLLAEQPHVRDLHWRTMYIDLADGLFDSGAVRHHTGRCEFTFGEVLRLSLAVILPESPDGQELDQGRDQPQAQRLLHAGD